MFMPMKSFPLAITLFSVTVPGDSMRMPSSLSFTITLLRVTFPTVMILAPYVAIIIEFAALVDGHGAAQLMVNK